MAPQDKFFESLYEQSNEMSRWKRLELLKRTGWDLILLDFPTCCMNQMRQSLSGTDWFFQSLPIHLNILINLRCRLQRRKYHTLLLTLLCSWSQNCTYLSAPYMPLHIKLSQTPLISLQPLSFPPPYTKPLLLSSESCQAEPWTYTVLSETQLTSSPTRVRTLVLLPSYHPPHMLWGSHYPKFPLLLILLWPLESPEYLDCPWQEIPNSICYFCSYSLANISLWEAELLDSWKQVLKRIIILKNRQQQGALLRSYRALFLKGN